MSKSILIIIAALGLMTNCVFACDIHGTSGFAPENNLRISQRDKAANGMTEEKFLGIIKKVSDIYSPIVTSKGGTLSMFNRWSDDTVNASAGRMGKIWVVTMFGGLARHPLVTEDAFALVVCHELAHHIGGAPKKGSSWLVSEGQADYFGSMKCLRRIFEKENNISIVSKRAIDKEVTNKCEMVYKNPGEIALCQRIAMAAKSLGNLLADLDGHIKIDFTTPDKLIVDKTNDNYPTAQCRLDTYFQGILCDKSYDQDTDGYDPIIGTCVSRDGYILGMRPLCWYKPTSDEI